MDRRSYIGALLALSLIANAFCLPASDLRIKRQSSDSSDVANTDITVKDTNDIDDDDDDDDFPSYPQNDSSGGGSNLFSLLNLVTAFLPGSSSSSGQKIQKFLKEIVKRNKPKIIIRREAIVNNEISNEYKDNFKPLPTKNNIETENSESESNESEQDSEESLENGEEKNQSDENSIELDEDDDDDYDEPPGGGDGGGGGILGLLAGLSGGEDDQSDLGSLLATISGIIANLSGDGIDLNALIASGIGLFVGLLSEGEENPGEILAGYLLTSLDTITGGGANNNGAFFGKFLSKLIKGTSAGQQKTPEEEGPSPLWTLKLDILRAIFQFGTSILGLASSSSSSSVLSASG